MIWVLICYKMHNMKVFILGAGRRGIRLAKRLLEEKNSVVLMDSDPESVNWAMTNIDCLAVEGKGTSIDDLRNAGIEQADVFIALSGSDRTNLISCAIVASEFSVPLTIASIRNYSYSDAPNGHSPIMGINHIVNPSQEVANHIYRNIERGIYSDIITFDNSSLVLYNIDIEKKSKFAGKKVKDIRRLIPGQFIIAALARNDHAIVPSGDTVLLQNDTLSICADENSVEDILKSVGQRKQRTKRIGIVGGTNVSEYLIEKFDEKKQSRITLIERDKKICEQFASKFPEILVINDSITREGFLKEEGIDNYDLLISLTENDELNIITASYAKHSGVKNTVALINNNSEYIRMADYLDVDTIISSQIITVDSVMKYLHGYNVSSLHSLFDGDLEALEYRVEESSPLCGKIVKDIDMKGKGIISGVVKNNGKKNETIIPDGNYVIEENDILLIVAERSSNDHIQNLLKTEEQG